MILIADSGSTKTAWRLIDQENIKQFVTAGINPNSMPAETCFEHLQELSTQIDSALITAVYYYGAGITDVTRPLWTNTLKDLFMQAVIEVHNDLLAAARAGLGKSEGLIAILGTGSNVGWYNGNEIEKKAPAMGYILGDEGAGVSIGKAVLKGYYRGNWPDEIQQAFARKFPWTIDAMIFELYNTDKKAYFLAQFSKWAFQQRKHETIQQLIIQVYQQFFEMIVEVFGAKPQELALVGSVAYYWSDYIKKVGLDYHININTIIESPIAALTLYHLDNK